MFLQEPVIGHGLLGAGAGGRERGQFPEVGGQLLFPACAVGVSGPTPIHSSATPTPAPFHRKCTSSENSLPSTLAGLVSWGTYKETSVGGAEAPLRQLPGGCTRHPAPASSFPRARFPLTSASTHAGLGGLPSTMLQTLIPAGPEYLVTRIPQRLHLPMYY